jgi:hypothetical protein
MGSFRALLAVVDIVAVPGATPCRHKHNTLDCKTKQ